MIINKKALIERYGVATANKALEVKKFLEKGNVKYAKKRINVLEKKGASKDLVDLLWSGFYKVSGDIEKAQSYLFPCLAVSPDFFLAEYLAFSLGTSFESKAFQQLSYAVKGDGGLLLSTFDRVLDAGLTEPNVYIAKFNLLNQLGRYDEAIPVLLQLPVKSRKGSAVHLLRQASNVPQSIPLDKELVRLIHNDVDLQPAHRNLKMYLLTLVDKGTSAVDRLSLAASSEVFHALLSSIVFKDIGVERCCSSLRSELLKEIHHNKEAFHSKRALIFSLLMQCYRNEYVYYVTLDEEHIVNGLVDELVSRAVDERWWDILAVVLCFRSPLSLSFLSSSAIDSDEPFNGRMIQFIDKVYQQNAQELELAKTFLEQSTLCDDTSEKVAGMYEENPYPRWTHQLNNTNKKQYSIARFFDFERSPHYQKPETDIQSILVAGCGTGRHPLSLAVNFPNIQITAVDISCRSLAYASLMAKKLDINNVEFRRCDILDLPSWGKQYDLVDSTGVVHHMADPERGITALMDCLKPNGILRLGLYSTAARHEIIRFRESLAIEDVNAKVIRELRKELMDRIDIEGDSDLLRFGDFYTVSGFRDLLLHEQECQYTLTEIRAMLARHHLTFLRMVNEKSIEQALTQLCGDNASPYCLDDWEKAESKEHFIFYNMYNFYAQKMV